MRTRKTILMNGRTSLILISGVLLLILLAAGISISAEMPGANTPPRGGADAATQTDAGARTNTNNADAVARAKARPVLEKFQQSPAVFIENQGQWQDASIRFAMNSMGANAGLTSQGVRFQLFQREAEPGQRMGQIGQIGQIGPMGQIGTRREADRSKIDRRNAARGKTDRRTTSKMKEFAIRFEGAREAAPSGDGKSEQVFHYRRGEQARWRENVPSWNAVVYRGLWEGVDLRVTGRRTGVKYEFLVSPGADCTKIRLRYEGVENLKLREDGALELNLGEGWKPLADAAPYIYQEAAGGRKQVAGKYVLVDARADAGAGSSEVGQKEAGKDVRVCTFEITGAFDPALPLVIDPELAWSTYLGGSSDDYGWGIAVDSAGNVFVTGDTNSSGWVSGGFDMTYDGGMDAFVVKLSGSGAHLWSTYLGGSDSDGGYGIAVDGAGNVFVTGGTGSSGWVSGGFDTTYNGGADAFVVKLSGGGAHLWSTYLGGSNRDGGTDIAVDGAGNMFVTGLTESSGWVLGGFDTAFNGVVDAFVVKLSGSGAHLWSTYLGGSDADFGLGIAVDGAGNVFVTGDTYSPGWVSGGFDTTFNGVEDAFVAKLSASGEQLWSTYLGGSLPDWVYDIAVDGAGNVFVTGLTGSPGWVSGGFDTTHNGGMDAFVVKLSGSGSHLWSTYLGGSGNDWGYGIAVDGAGNVFVAGDTRSSGWVSGGFDTTYNGGTSDAFVAKIKDGPALTGSLCVTIQPPECVAAGAKWRRVGTTNWLDSGYAESGILTGDYTVEFKDIPGWIKPANVGVTISAGQTTNANGTYLPAGSLCVTILPAEVVVAGAQWRRVGTTNWLDSNYTESGLRTGSYTVEFKDVSGWTKPGNVAVTISGGQTTNASGIYQPPRCTLVWSSYLGGNGSDYGYGIAVDGAGNVFVTGETGSSGWVSGGFDTTFDGDEDAFVVKLSANGAHLWSTYLGGDSGDSGNGIALDGVGNVFVTGQTWSSGWVSGGFDTTYNGGGDSFVVKLSGSGSHLWSTYLGGSAGDVGADIAVDGAGNVFVTGGTESSGWVSGGFDTTNDGWYDAFLVKLSESGSHLWSTYLGGSDDDEGDGIAVDGAGNVFVTGWTDSSSWVSGGFDTTLDGIEDAFVAKLSASGSHLWSTYLGGLNSNSGSGIAVDGAGNALITGITYYSSGWVSGGFDTTPDGWSDAFLVKLSGSGSHLWSTYLGGSGGDSAWGIAVDGAGNVFVTGWTDSPGWLSGGFDTTYNGGGEREGDAFVAKLSESGAHLWSTYLGGSGDDTGGGIAVDGEGNVFVTGETKSSGWVSGGFDTTYNGGAYYGDAFVVKIRDRIGPCKVPSEAWQLYE